MRMSPRPDSRRAGARSRQVRVPGSGRLDARLARSCRGQRHLRCVRAAPARLEVRPASPGSHLLSRARIAPTRGGRRREEAAESADLDPVAFGERVAIASRDGLDRELRCRGASTGQLPDAFRGAGRLPSHRRVLSDPPLGTGGGALRFPRCAGHGQAWLCLLKAVRLTGRWRPGCPRHAWRATMRSAVVLRTGAQQHLSQPTFSYSRSAPGPRRSRRCPLRLDRQLIRQFLRSTLITIILDTAGLPSRMLRASSTRSRGDLRRTQVAGHVGLTTGARALDRTDDLAGHRHPAVVPA